MIDLNNLWGFLASIHHRLVLFLFLGFLGGLALGFFYFGGLWLTVQRLSHARRPALLSLGSFSARLGVTLGGFYLVTGGQWERILACLGGFLLARKLLVSRLRPEGTELSRNRG